jgi:hypothetical protein
MFWRMSRCKINARVKSKKGGNCFVHRDMHLLPTSVDLGRIERRRAKHYGVFGRVVPRAYSVVARLSSIGTSFVYNTHNSHCRCRQSAVWYNSQRTLLRNADS